jgi:hypothetical protein
LGVFALLNLVKPKIMTKTILPDIKRIALKLAASIAPSLKANLDKTEFAAKAISARKVVMISEYINTLYG